MAPPHSDVAVKLKLRKFQMGWIRDDAVVVFIGKRGSGKSTVCLDLLYHKQDIPFGTCISPTEDANGTYRDCIPPPFIHTDLGPPLLEKVLTRQKTLVRKMKEDVAYRDVDARAFLLMDDCMYDDGWTRDKSIRNVFMNGRHFKLLYIVCLQYCLGLPPVLRTNIDWVFLMRENIYQNKKKLYEIFGGMFRTYETFSQVFDACTEDYGCMVIHLGSKSSKIEDMVFWYKAQIRREQTWRMCLDLFWANTKEAEQVVFEEAGDTLNTYSAKKGSVMVNVCKLEE